MQTKKFILLALLIFTMQASLANAGSAPTAISVQNTPVVTAASSTENQKTSDSSSSGDSIKGKKSFGLMGSGYYEINTDMSRLYYNFTLKSTHTAGFGISTFFEYGIAERFSLEFSLGYSRLLYASKQRGVINENYFVADVDAHYYFLNSEKFGTYAIGGAGAIVSSGSVVPVGDIGIGNYFKITPEVSIKAELIFKSAIVFNRGEGRVGIAYTF